MLQYEGSEEKKEEGGTSGSGDEGEVGLFEVWHETGVLLGYAEPEPLVALVQAPDLLRVPSLPEDLFRLVMVRGQRGRLVLDLPLLQWLLHDRHGATGTDSSSSSRVGLLVLGFCRDLGAYVKSSAV